VIDLPVDPRAVIFVIAVVIGSVALWVWMPDFDPFSEARRQRDEESPELFDQDEPRNNVRRIR
jgi:hypothetical protein